MTERTVPYDLTAERAVLGAILLERDAVLAVSDLLTPDDFYLEKHAQIYQAMLTCLAHRIPPDLATVTAELLRREQLELVGGVSFLGELTMAVPTAVHVVYYAEVVILRSRYSGAASRGCPRATCPVSRELRRRKGRRYMTEVGGTCP